MSSFDGFQLIIDTEFAKALRKPIAPFRKPIDRPYISHAFLHGVPTPDSELARVKVIPVMQHIIDQASLEKYAQAKPEFTRMTKYVWKHPYNGLEYNRVDFVFSYQDDWRAEIGLQPYEKAPWFAFRDGLLYWSLDKADYLSAPDYGHDIRPDTDVIRLLDFSLNPSEADDRFINSIFKDVPRE